LHLNAPNAFVGANKSSRKSICRCERNNIDKTTIYHQIDIINIYSIIHDVVPKIMATKMQATMRKTMKRIDNLKINKKKKKEAENNNNHSTILQDHLVPIPIQHLYYQSIISLIFAFFLQDLHERS
jgi:short subunit fatty acids transporter